MGALEERFFKLNTENLTLIYAGSRGHDGRGGDRLPMRRIFEKGPS